jgi:hypothetical protein
VEPGVAEDLGGRFREFIQVDAQVALVLAEALCRRVRQTRQTFQIKDALVLTETLRRRVRQARQALEPEVAFVLTEALSSDVR